MCVILTNKEELDGNSRIGGSLHSSDHDMVIRILQWSSGTNGTTALDFRREVCNPLRYLLGRILC